MTLAVGPMWPHHWHVFILSVSKQPVNGTWIHVSVPVHSILKAMLYQGHVQGRESATIKMILDHTLQVFAACLLAGVAFLEPLVVVAIAGIY
jgi:hypothetical protein